MTFPLSSICSYTEPGVPFSGALDLPFVTLSVSESPLEAPPPLEDCDISTPSAFTEINISPSAFAEINIPSVTAVTLAAVMIKDVLPEGAAAITPPIAPVAPKYANLIPSAKLARSPTNFPA